MIREASSELIRQFSELRSQMAAPRERAAAERTYQRLAEVDFSRHILTKINKSISVVAVIGLDWSDLGDPARLAELSNFTPNASAARAVGTSNAAQLRRVKQNPQVPLDRRLI